MIPWRLECYEELGSTSDLVVTRAKAGEPSGLAVLALRQTAGRGSRGRAWSAPEGNLNLSILLRPTRPAAEAGLFSLVAGIAVAQALAGQGAQGLSLKWPNDILCDGAKLAGILIDAVPDGARLDWLVIGIGINLRQAPEIPGRRTTALAAQGLVLAPEDAARAILARLEPLLEAPGEEIRAAWLALGHPLGTKLDIAFAGQRRAGLFAGLSPAGELLLQCENRIEALNTGEVLLANG
ncbi:biotin--[acetyl-CoA-carboxylase] ligase [Acidocella facilis]|uniref:biotin--[acetyl-CoA-carboxylase] ligase n=1 Tax=Acidocella facilis TaxID=525 RepID=UPI00068F4A6A|nr:biotin--[acetyl-CoA-carboxylase] ligase [Acidocella facilis]